MKQKLAIASLMGLSVLAVALFVFLKTPRQLVADLPPAALTPPLGDPPETKSYVNVPVSIPIATLERELRDRVPTAFSIPRRRNTVRVLGLRACVETAPMRFERTRLSLVRRGQRLAALLAGRDDEISAKGKLGPCRGPVSGPTAHATDVLFGLAVRSRVRVAGNWELELHDMDVDFDMEQALVDFGILGLREVNIADNIAPYVEDAAEAETRQRVGAAVNSIVTHRDYARTVWNAICSIVDLPIVPELHVAISPTRAYIDAPRLTPRRIALNVGLELVAQAGIIPVDEREPPKCPFPNTVGRPVPSAPGFTFVVPTDLRYDELESAMAALIADSIVEVPEAGPVVVSDIGFSAHGAGVLLQITLDPADEDDWFRRHLRGTVYVAAVPALDAAGQTISLSNIQVDTSSRNVLVDLAGELLEPALKNKLQAHQVIDLAPIVARAKQEAAAGLSRLSENEALDASLRALQLSGLQVGSDGLRLLMDVDGDVEVTLED